MTTRSKSKYNPFAGARLPAADRGLDRDVLVIDSTHEVLECEPVIPSDLEQAHMLLCGACGSIEMRHLEALAAEVSRLEEELERRNPRLPRK